MPKFIDITGKKFGRLTVISRADNLKDRTNWNCVCECGSTRAARGSNLLSGRTTSCGCFQKDAAKRRMLKHGRSYKDGDQAAEYARETHVLRKYGITYEQYAEVVERQGNKCAICGYEFGQKKGDAYVDHCHTTGVVRGLLCMNCNAGIGHFLDDTARLAQAIDYLNDSDGHVTPKFPMGKYAERNDNVCI